jgi:Holliday junction resolvase RusA-like endonuclease
MNAQQKITPSASAQWQRVTQPYIRLDLPFPPSVNHIWKHGGKGKGYRSERYVQWARVAGTLLNAQRPGRIDGPYRLKLLLARPDNRRRDLDNFLKSVSDLLVEHHVVDDDSLAEQVAIGWSSRIEGCRVTLTPVNPLTARRAA